jgi:hypothetical protein
MQADEEVASRCETVLNTTMAEMDIYHTQKVEDFASLAKEHLDGEIEFYEQVKSKVSHHLGVERTFPVQLIFIYFKKNAGPRPSTHSAPHVRAADIPASSVRRHAQPVHLRAGPRTAALEPGPAPAAVPARVGPDADAAREPRDPGGRRAPPG